MFAEFEEEVRGEDGVDVEVLWVTPVSHVAAGGGAGLTLKSCSWASKSETSALESALVLLFNDGS